MGGVAFSSGVGAVRRLRRSALVGAVLAGAMLAVPELAAATVFNVTGTSDGTGACSGSSCPSLRAAVLASNNTGGPNTINVPAGHYTLTLTPTGSDDATTGDLNIFTDVTIKGAGPATTTITGKNDRL